MATRSSTKPRAATTSVAPGSREQMRMSAPELTLEGFEVVPLHCGRDGIRARELVGRIGRGNRQTSHPGRMGRLDAGDGVFNDEAVRRVARRPSAHGLQGAQVPFRIGLPVPDVLGCGDVLEAGPQTNGLKYLLDLVAQRARHDRQAVAASRPLDEVLYARIDDWRDLDPLERSEERRVGKECRSRW